MVDWRVGAREVRAIAGALGPEWGESMRWPLGEVEVERLSA